MARKYAFKFAEAVPSEVRAQFPDHLEAGPVTIESKLRDIQSRLGAEYEVIEDEHDYLVHVRRSVKPKKAT